MKRLYKNIAYEAMYGEGCIVLDNELVKQYIDESERISEGSQVQGVYSDEGLYDFFASFRDYRRVTKLKATQVIGWPVVEYLLDKKASDPFYELGMMEDDGSGMKGRADSVSYGGAVIMGDENPLASDRKYMKEMENIISELGWEIIKWMGVGPNRKSQVIVIPSYKLGEEPGKLNEDVVILVEFKEEFGAPAGLLPSPSRKEIEKAKKRKDKSIYAEKENKIDKLIAIYPGRFQPFGPHHKEQYKFLKKRFDTVYVVTSNKSGGSRHPMNFSQKKRHMQKMGIPGSAIKMENQPYIPKGILNKENGDTTAVIFAVGEKDEGRLSGGKYFKQYRQNYNRLEGFDHHGYTLKLPHTSIRVGGMELSGTTMRKLLGSDKFDIKSKQKFFKSMFGYFDQKTFNNFVKSFKEEIKLDVEIGDTILVGRFKNKRMVVKDIGVDKHGMPTINGRKVTTFRYTKDPNAFNESFTAVNNDTGNTSIFDTEDARDAAIKKGTHSKVKAKKPKIKTPKFTMPKIPSIADKMKKDAERKRKYGGKKREQNIVDGVDTIRDEDDLDHFKHQFLKEGDTVADMDEYEKRVAEQYRKQKESMPEEERRQLEDDAKSWKQHGGYEAIQIAIRDGDITEQDILDRNERMSETAHESVVTVEQPIERGISIPAEDADAFLERFVEGEIVEIPDEKGHGSSGFSLSSDTARFFSRAEKDNETDDVSILIRIQPNEKGEMRGLYIDGEDAEFSSEMEIIRSSKSKAKVISVERVKYPNGKMVIIITLQEPDNLTESDSFIGKMLAQQEDDTLSKKYLEGPLNPRPKNLTKENKKELLLMGGAYGHMAHPFDDYALTFGELKEIIDLGLQGKLDKEESVTEKLDGQNIMISCIDGIAKAARNKGDLKSGGMNLKGVKAKFANHLPSVRDAFVFSMKDIASSVERMSKKDQEALFANGKNWANIEIIYPGNKNVIDYDGPATIVFHGILKYNQAWVPSGMVKSGGAKLSAIINAVNKGIKTKFAFKGPNVLKLHKVKDYTATKSKYISSLNKLQNIYRLKDSDELSLWHQHFWLEYILAGANSTDYRSIPDNVLYPLMKRWAFSDKSYKMTEINKLKADHPKFVDWVRTTEKLDHAGMLKANMAPFEEIFFGVGAEILANASNYLSVNPSHTSQKLRNDLEAAAKALRSKKDFSNIGKLKAQLRKLKAMPSISKAAPTEGLVFKYKGKVFKFTGFFAPINQILGLQKFSR